MYDITDLDNFYHSPRGQKLAAQLAQDIAALWQPARTASQLAVGYPFLFLPEDQLPPVLMPTPPGALVWPGHKGVISALTAPHSWPIASDQTDYLLITHALEFAPDPAQFMAEAARVLSGSGQLLVMIPNRNSRWVASRGPFGEGLPYSRGQITRLLDGAGLKITAVNRSLLLPPIAGLASESGLGRAARRLGRMLGGVLLVQATKMVYVKKKRKSAARLGPLAPVMVRPLSGQGLHSQPRWQTAKDE